MHGARSVRKKLRAMRREAMTLLTGPPPPSAEELEQVRDLLMQINDQRLTDYQCRQLARRALHILRATLPDTEEDRK